MRIPQRFATHFVLLGTALAFAAAPGALSAQDGVPTADAEMYVGSWALPLETDMGPIDVTIEIEDADGRIAATVGSLEGSAEVDEITMEGGNLVFDFSMDAQGQMMPVTMTLTPAGSNLAVAVDVADGMFVASGTAMRAGD